MGKAFRKQIKTIEDQGEEQVEALKDLKPKEQTKQLKINLIIVNQELQLYLTISLKKERALYESVDYNNLKFEYVGPTKNVSFYEYIDSKELFNKKKNQIKFDDALKKQKLFLNKLNDIKIGGKND